MSEALNQDIRLFRARLNDGSQVSYKALWQGFADFDWGEDGEAATWKHPYDDRRCHWRASGRILRRVAVVVAGQEYWNDALTTAFSAGQDGQGGSFVLTNLHPENCNDCAQRRDSDFDNMRNRVNGALAATVQGDLQNVINSIRGLPGVVEVNLPG